MTWQAKEMVGLRFNSIGVSDGISNGTDGASVGSAIPAAPPRPNFMGFAIRSLPEKKQTTRQNYSFNHEPQYRARRYSRSSLRGGG